MTIVQYPDKNISPKDYDQFGDNLLVTRLFRTIQGEGPLSGTVSVFIRLAGCNKGDKNSCFWCDANFLFSKGKSQSVTELVDEVKTKFAETYHYQLGQPPLVVITGGEPMIQNNLTKLVDGLLAARFRVQIESNGDRLAKGFSESTLCNDSMLVVSPKVNPRSKRYQRLSKEVFNRVDALKFVVEADKSSPYHELPDYVYDFVMKKNTASKVFVSPCTVYLRPVAENEVASVWTQGLINREETAANYAYAAELCMKSGYSLSCQIHTFLAVE